MTHGRAFRFRWKTSALNKFYNNFSVAVIFQGEHDHELINYILFGLHNAWHTLEKTKFYTFPVKGISQNFFTNIFQDSLKLRANYSVLKYFKETVANCALAKGIWNVLPYLANFSGVSPMIQYVLWLFPACMSHPSVYLLELVVFEIPEHRFKIYFNL